MAVFGKNILENLTTGMYSDAKVMYREYVQNSCDAIDAAVKAGIIARRDAVHITITIDESNRKICIRDEGIGVGQQDFVRVLSDIANSDKSRTDDKGFRGIGRLCGLAYCEKLLFVSSTVGEEVKNVMEWDARTMRTMLNDDKKRSADEVLGDIMTTYSSECDSGDHFFEVTMIGVTEDDLLDENAIRKYLEFEIPVPYASKFMFSGKIYDYAASLGETIDEYKVFVNLEQIFKEYSSRIYSNQRRVDEVKDVEFREFTDRNDNRIAWMWYGISSLNGQMKAKENPQRGLRLRKGNIQIGGASLLRRLFKDPRGNEYFMGEIFAVHPDLIPNARRDNFNANAARNELEHNLREFFDYLWKLCNIASDERSAYKAVKGYFVAHDAHREKVRMGFSGDVDRERTSEELEEKRKKAEKGQKTLERSRALQREDRVTARVKEIVRSVESSQLPDPFVPIPNVLEENDALEGGKKARPVFITDELSQYPKETRRVVGKIYDLINQNAPDIAQGLIEKIHAGLKEKRG